MHRSLALTATVILLAGCTPTEDRAPGPAPAPVTVTPAPMPTTQPAPPSDAAKADPGAISPLPPPAADACGAGKLADYLGQLPTTETIARIQTLAGHGRIRVIKPGDAVTMDFREDRLNVEIGEDGRIKRLRCG